MLDPISASIKIAASGLSAQSLRMQIVSENLANSQSTAATPGGDPYRRKVLSFGSELDRASGLQLVQVNGISRDRSNFQVEHRPGHPAADAKGNVKLPNVNVLMEMADMREAGRSYEANLQVIKQGRDLISMTLDLLRTT